MGQLYNFCAGVEVPVLPSREIKSILINIPKNASTENQIRNTWKLLNITNAERSIADSGGYQIHVYEKAGRKISHDPNRPLICNGEEINLAPEHVVEAAAKLRPTLFMGLDFPIRTIDDPAEQEHEFLSKAGFNAVWARKCSELRARLCPEVGFFIPIQCYTLEQLDKFIAMIQGVTYDGFSMPVRNASVEQIILFMVRFYQIGVRRVHLLGTTSLLNMSVAAYMARNYFDWVSFDATTWRQWAEYSLYMNPWNLLQEVISDNVIIDEAIEMDCQCPFCRGKTFTYIKNLPYTDRTSFLRCHNWWVLENTSADLYRHSETAIMLQRFLRARGADEKDVNGLCRALSLADALKNQNIDVLRGLLS